MRSKSFSRFLRERSEVRVTTSLMPVVDSVSRCLCCRWSDGSGRGGEWGLTRIFGIFRADVFVACVEDVLVHQRSSRRDLSEEADLDWLANLDPLALLDEYLSGVLASVFAVEGWDAVLLGVVALFERLEGGHEVVAASDSGGDDTLCDAGCDSTFDDSGDRVHGTDDLGLELRWDVEFDLLEEVFGGTEATHDEDVLEYAVLGLNGNDLVADKFENAIYDGLETLQNLFVGEGHVTFFDTRVWEFGLNANIDSPFLTVVPEVGLYPVLEVHDTLRVDFAGGLGAVRKLHFPDLGT